MFNVVVSSAAAAAVVVSSAAAAASVTATAAVNMPGGTMRQVHTRVGPALVPPGLLVLFFFLPPACGRRRGLGAVFSCVPLLSYGVWPRGLWTLAVWRCLMRERVRPSLATSGRSQYEAYV